MKREFINKDKSILVYTCDNLGEYFTEFAKYRKAASESDDWDKDLSKMYINKGVQCFREDHGDNFFGRTDSRIVDFFIFKDYNNDFEGRNGRLELELPVDLKSPEWLSQKEKINQTLKEIWKTGEFKNSYGLDLNWPSANQPNDGSQKEQEKKEITKALQGDPQIDSSPEKAEKQFKSHIGFKKEKERFKDYVELYLSTKGEFCPEKEIICYAGAPGMGKTTFVQTLSQATGRKLQTISCAGLKEFKNYSILGDENKPSLVAWAIKESESKNPIILLDELEKIEDEQIQRDLITLFELYKNKEGVEKEEYHSKKLFDKYYQMDIELDHITFFATVNYPQNLVPRLKKEVKMRSLEDYTNKEKEEILKLKKAEIEKKWEAVYGEKKEIIPEQIIKLLPQYIKEGGIRQAERVLFKIEREHINAKENNGREFSLGDPQKWLKKNVLAYQESFSPGWKHYGLFSLWIIIWILSLAVIINKIILRKERNKAELSQKEKTKKN